MEKAGCGSDADPLALCGVAEVRETDEGFEVVREGHRRGPVFVELESAILHGEGVASEVAVLNRSGKVERMVTSRGTLAALVAEHGAAVADECRLDEDDHWRICCWWSYGEPLGWFVEHEGRLYSGIDSHGDGPHETPEAAERCLAGHLRAAIAEERSRWGRIR